MVILIVVLLTAINIAIRLSIYGMEMAVLVANRVESARSRAEGGLQGSKGSKSLIKRSVAATGRVALRTVKVGLKAVRFCIARVRDLIAVLGSFFLILELVLLLIIGAAAAGFGVLFYDGTSLSGQSSYSMAGSNSSTMDNVKDLNFEKYSITDDELEVIARICYSYEASVDGSASFASLMCNKYEISGNSYDSIYDYVVESGVFAGAEEIASSDGSVEDSVLSVVENVIVKGFRVLPGYVDSYDVVDDMDTASNDDGLLSDVTDTGSYVQHETVINNVYGDSYVFYSAETGIFGYSDGDLRSEKGDDCYTVSEAIEGKASSSGSKTNEFLMDCIDPDPSYRGQVWEVTDKELVINTISREYGGDYNGSVLVAQVIRDLMIYNKTHTFQPVFDRSFGGSFPDYVNDASVRANAEKAYDYIFNQGGSAVQHMIHCYYATNIIDYAEWQEKQILVKEYEYSRFFCMRAAVQQ